MTQDHLSFFPTFALAGDLVPQDVDLVDRAKVLEHDLQQGFHIKYIQISNDNPDFELTFSSASSIVLGTCPTNILMASESFLREGNSF